MAEDWRTDKRLIVELPYVQQHLDDAAGLIAYRFVAGAAHHLRVFTVESPIEAAFYIWWMALLTTKEINENRFGLMRQYEVVSGARRYRLDFAIEPHGEVAERIFAAGLMAPKIGVELDGHDFHERTKEQVALRNERDRALLADGWDILHFSGSEFQAAPMKCIHDVYGHAYFAYQQIEGAVAEALDRKERYRQAALRSADESIRQWREINERVEVGP